VGGRHHAELAGPERSTHARRADPSARTGTQPTTSLTLPTSTAIASLPLQFGGDLLSVTIGALVPAVAASLPGFSGVAGVSWAVARLAALAFVVIAFLR
jgi:hypothetical protein